jgi:hypothetical protein
MDGSRLGQAVEEAVDNHPWAPERKAAQVDDILAAIKPIIEEERDSECVYIQRCIDEAIDGQLDALVYPPYIYGACKRIADRVVTLTARAEKAEAEVERLKQVWRHAMELSTRKKAGDNPGGSRLINACRQLKEELEADDD